MGIAQLGARMTLPEVQRMVAEVDENGDGQLDFSEFMLIIRRVMKKGMIPDTTSTGNGSSEGGGDGSNQVPSPPSSRGSQRPATGSSADADAGISLDELIAKRVNDAAALQSAKERQKERMAMKIATGAGKIRKGRGEASGAALMRRRTKKTRRPPGVPKKRRVAASPEKSRMSTRDAALLGAIKSGEKSKLGVAKAKAKHGKKKRLRRGAGSMA